MKRGMDSGEPSLRPHKVLKTCLLSDNKNAGSDEAEDRISQLPNHLLWLIISSLTPRDAIKTNILSHRWKDICCSVISGLTLDWPNMFMTDDTQHLWARTFDKQLHDDESLPPSTYGDLCGEYRDKIVQGVTCLLNYCCRQKLSIPSFNLSFCLGSDHKDDIDQWVSKVLDMGIEQLKLDFCCVKNRYRFMYEWEACLNNPQNKYLFCGELFRTSALKTKLKDLHLSACLLGNASDLAIHLTSLEKLTLTHIPLASYPLEDLLSCSQNLKYMKLHCCRLPRKLFLGLLDELKWVEINDCQFIEEIELLNNLKLEGILCHHMAHTISCNFMEAPNLELFVCPMDVKMVSHVFNRAPEKHLLKLDVLGVFTSIDWVNSIPNNVNMFKQVSVLFLHLRKPSRFNTAKMIGILEAFPSLCHLHLSTYCHNYKAPDEDGDSVSIEELKLCDGLKNLELVWISGFNSTPGEIDFISYLLEHAIGLKQIIVRKNVITQKYNLSYRTWRTGERERILELFI